MLKMRESAAMFDFHITRNEYWNALKIKRQIQSVAVFVELDEMQMRELFGDSGYRKNAEVQDTGLINSTKVEKAQLECCIKRNYSIQKLTYQEVMEIWQKKRD